MSLNTLAKDAVQKAGGTPPPPVDNILIGLTKYIPTETVTLYVASCGAMEAVQAGTKDHWFNAQFAYITCLVLTPVFQLLLYWVQANSVGKAVKDAGICWWKMIAAMIAFGIWALAVPKGILEGRPGEMALAGLGALLVSTILSLVSPLVEAKPPMPGPDQ